MQTRESPTFLLLLLILVSGFALTSCGSAADPKGPDSLNLHMLCPASDDGESVTCDGHKRLTHFNSWVKEAVYLPHSTFSIWAVSDRSRSRRVFMACIPDHWNAPVWEEKAKFLRVAREGAAGSRTGQTAPAGCSPPGPTTPGRTQLVVSPDISPLKPEVWQSVSAAPAAPVHSGIVCDRSGSTLGSACTTSALLHLFDSWLTESLVAPNSTLSVEIVGPPRDALQSIFSLRVPNLPVAERVAYALGARGELSRLFAGPGEQYASTIAEAISTAVWRLRDHRGAYRLAVLSDLRQITTGVWDFERALPQPKDFLAWLKKGLAADLQGIPVLVCGTHSGHFGNTSAAYTTRLHDLWQAVFQAMGATEISLYSSCDAALNS